MSVNLAGNPALAMPIAMPRVGKTAPMTSLQLIGPLRSEAELLNLGRIIAARP
jgi:amidase